MKNKTLYTGLVAGLTVGFFVGTCWPPRQVSGRTILNTKTGQAWYLYGEKEVPIVKADKRPALNFSFPASWFESPTNAQAQSPTIEFHPLTNGQTVESVLGPPPESAEAYLNSTN